MCCASHRTVYCWHDVWFLQGSLSWWQWAVRFVFWWALWCIPLEALFSGRQQAADGAWHCLWQQAAGSTAAVVSC